MRDVTRVRLRGLGVRGRVSGARNDQWLVQQHDACPDALQRTRAEAMGRASSSLIDVLAALHDVSNALQTDVKTLGDRFGSLAGILRASVAELQVAPGS